MPARTAPLLALLVALAAFSLAACASQEAAPPAPAAAAPSATATPPLPTATRAPKPTATVIPPTATSVPPTATAVPPTATPPPVRQVEAGWLLHDDPKEGFSVALPIGWEHYSGEREELRQGFGLMRQQHPLLATTYSDRRCDCLHKAGWRLFAFDTAPESRDSSYPATLIVYKFSGLNDPAIEDLEASRIEQLLETDGVVQPVVNETVFSEAGPGRRLWYLSNSMLDDATQQPLFTAEYLLTKGNTIYYLVLTSSLDQQGHYAPLIDKILRSFQAEETVNADGTF